MSSLSCSLCNKILKSATIYSCSHRLCDGCDALGSCAVCSTKIQQPKGHTESIYFEWSSHKMEGTPIKQTQEAQYVSTTHRQIDMSRSRQTSLFCQKHDEPMSFYHPQGKVLMCATCLYNVGRQPNSNYSSAKVAQQVLPLRNALEMMKDELSKTTTELTEQSSRLDQALKTCRHSKTIIESNYQSIIEEVSTICQTMVKMIRKKEESVKEAIQKMLNQRLLMYNDAEKQLSRHRAYLKEFKSTAINIKKSDKVEQVAYLFYSGKELTDIMNNVKMDYPAFGLSELNLLNFNKKAFQECLNTSLFVKAQPQGPCKTRQKSAKSRLRKSSEGRVGDRSVSYLSLLRMKDMVK